MRKLAGALTVVCGGGMKDVVYLAVTLAVFGVAWLALRGVERL